MLKPSLHTPMTSCIMAECVLEAGLPRGMMSVLHGDGEVAQWLLSEPAVRFFAFTGSTQVGRLIQQAAGLRRTQMELGSIAHCIVCDDADLDAALPKVISASYRKAGQVCTSIQLLLVQRARVAEVERKLADLVKALPYGDPGDDKTVVGPVISETAAKRIESWIDDAVARGARRLAGGERRGAVVPPTLLADGRQRTPLGCQEVFGPVMCIAPFDSVDDAIARVNSTPFGLATGIFTKRLDHALQARAAVAGRRRAHQRDAELSRGCDALRRIEGQRVWTRRPPLLCSRDERRAYGHHAGLNGRVPHNKDGIMPKMKGGEVIAEYLVKQKVPFVFGICGHGNVGILDALHAVRDKITLVSPAARAMRGPYGGRLFPCEASSGCNADVHRSRLRQHVMSCATALSDSSTFMAITANVPTSQANRAPFQELYAHNQADFAQVLRPVVKRSFQPTRVDMLPLALRQGFDTMVTGRPGPVNLDIPYNVFRKRMTSSCRRSPTCTARTVRAPATPISQARSICSRSRNGRCSSSGRAPPSPRPAPNSRRCSATSAFRSSPRRTAMGCVPADDPLTLGFIGRNGAYPANQAGRHADLVICIGTRASTIALRRAGIRAIRGNFPSTKLLQVDIDPAELGRNYPPTLGIIADAKVFAAQLLAGLSRRRDITRDGFAGWRSEVATWRAEWEAFVRPNFSAVTTPIRPEYVVGALTDVLPDDVILSLDSGVHHNWFMQFWKPKRAQSMLNSWGYSSMGFGVCGILGAQLAAPDRPCVAVVGDGGFMMAPYVVATAVEYSLPCVWIVWNNFAWGAIRDLQYGLFEGREHAPRSTRAIRAPAAIATIRTSRAWARACGADGVTVTRSEDLRGAVETAVKNRRPCVIDVHVDSEVRPPSTGTWELPRFHTRNRFSASRIAPAKTTTNTISGRNKK